jgi:LysR family transcriptional regulator for bpeEF and oprC
MQAFIAVAETCSFSKAAASLGLARSSVSGIVRRLEDYLGIALVERTTRTVTLTPQGLMYYRVCRQLLRALQRAEANLRSDDERKPGASLFTQDLMRKTL